ncbi:ARM repeat-containing protein [Saitoella complicata NRRL Y-17804]|uniref:ARM repeat-containing protein n=1 Tax=Saitoella complicata (strain BCRC 22490 / CBS 7301 / JCM 7358 / NBRC 10748 / NRRL Y-17804) TaxID=698492 RepID=UPI000867C6CE|nr:ARM repeat-containing protein [Saitoella complicata NRRL Y-17804]ODQ56534.1 ARM repeat-containing protein [Saitoella complicata NRRL Y-17804]
MPKERKQRGRRAEKKREEEDLGEDQYTEQVNEGRDNYEGYDNGYEGQEQRWPDREELPEGAVYGQAFFGILDVDEEKYFKGIEDVLTANNFGDSEERQIFIDNVFEEIKGQELKLATSPTSSKLLEQLLANAPDSALKKFFEALNGHFLELVKHRFASHVCETLFTLCARVVDREVRAPDAQFMAGSDEPVISMENLFLYMCNELQPQIRFLVEDRFASHVLRIVLLVLSGRPPTSNDDSSTLRSKKSAKFKSRQMNSFELKTSDGMIRIPRSFRETVRQWIDELAGHASVADVRAVAVNPVGNPVIQLLLEIEAAENLKGENGETLVAKLLYGQDEDHEGGEEERDDYVETLLRDAVGSHLLECIVRTVKPDMVPKLYKAYFKGRLAKLSQHAIANFVAQRVIERLETEKLVNEVAHEIMPLFDKLLKTSRTGVIKAVLEACAKQNVQTEEVVNKLIEAMGCDRKKPADILPTMFKMESKELQKEARREEKKQEKIRKRKEAVAKGEEWAIKKEAEAKADEEIERTSSRSKLSKTGAFLAISVVQLPGDVGHFIVDSVLAQPRATILEWAVDAVASPVLEACLKRPTLNAVTKRRLLNYLDGKIVELACDAAGSHVVDACLNATMGLQNYRESIAAEFLAKAEEVRGHFYGRHAWRNWKMDLCKNKKAAWIAALRSEDNRRESTVKLPEPVTITPVVEDNLKKEKRKRSKEGEEPADEIDNLFAAAEHKTSKKAKRS